MRLLHQAATVALLLSATTAQADEWTRVDTALELTGAALHLADWSQTLSIAHANELTVRLLPSGAAEELRAPRFGETNPILGRAPSVATVNAYFAATLVGHAAVAYLLPHPYRTVWQALWIGLEGGMVANNLRLGVHFSLP